MLNRILLSASLLSLFSGVTCAAVSPVGGLRVGANWTEWGGSDSVAMVEGFLPDRYVADEVSETSLGGGAFLGGEWHTQQSPWRVQAVISYDTFSNVEAKGDILEFGAPHLNDLSYRYNLWHQRVDGEFKVLRKVGAWYPYVTGALGVAWNKSYDYQERTRGSEVPRENIYTDTTVTRFTWSAGAGIERRFGPCWRVGLGYLYTDAGNAKLDAVSSGDSLEVDNLSVSQALLQVTYIMPALD